MVTETFSSMHFNAIQFTHSHLELRSNLVPGGRQAHAVAAPGVGGEGGWLVGRSIDLALRRIDSPMDHSDQRPLPHAQHEKSTYQGA